MKKMICRTLAALTVFMVMAPALMGAANPRAVIHTGKKSQIDVTYKDDAYVKIKSLEKNPKKLMVKIEKDKTTYTYTLDSTGKEEIYSLQMGDGTYTIKVLENIEGTRYSVIQTQTVKVKYNRPNAPFLIPVQNISFSETSKVVKKAAELCKGVTTEIGKVEKIYQFIVETIKYDFDKAKQVTEGKLNGYLPSVDVIFDAKKGICYDYSSVMAAMLRSQGIPTKLVTGYVAPKNVYHAWNDVFITGQGWIKIQSSVYFDGKAWSRMDSTFAAGNTSGKKNDFIGDGSNYAPKDVY